MIHPVHLRQLIVDPTLKYLDMYSPSGSNLMMGTAAQESHLGHYLMQVDQMARPMGPALGIYEMEGQTHFDLYQTYLNRPDKVDLRKLIEKLSGVIYADDDRLIYNLKYATAMARLKYWRDSEPLPQAGDIEGLAHIWKRVYNTEGGKGTVEEFMLNYERFVTNG